jgi:hypothetical protein
MNNVWYPYVEMADDADLKTQGAELRMNAYATHGGGQHRRQFLRRVALQDAQGDRHGAPCTCGTWVASLPQ